ncbi:hypothetical protein Tco_1371421 [Tanacetum coccineum]
MSLSYSTVAWTAALDKGVQPNIDYSYKAHSTAGRVFSFFNALGTIAFSYAGHSVVLNTLQQEEYSVSSMHWVP